MKQSVNLILCIFFISVIPLLFGCKKGDPAEISTVEVTGITNNSAVSGGTIISDGGCDITEKGVCWNKTGNPVIETDPKTSNGEGSGNFTSNITGLEAATTYYLKAYATNGCGTSYGEEFTFTTKVADADGNLYNTVKIGNQVWMVENLKTTKYNDNTTIPLVTDNTEWTTLTTAAYSWADNNEAQYKDLYGAFYNWYAVETGKLCPSGWHVPTDADFKTLEMSLGMTQVQADASEWRGTDQGKKMKNTTGWASGGNGTNASGFSAMPSGYRAYATGASDNLGTLCYLWTANQSNDDIAMYRRLDGNNDAVYRNGTYKRAGKAVRCVKD